MHDRLDVRSGSGKSIEKRLQVADIRIVHRKTSRLIDGFYISKSPCIYCRAREVAQLSTLIQNEFVCVSVTPVGRIPHPREDGSSRINKESAKQMRRPPHPCLP